MSKDQILRKLLQLEWTWRAVYRYVKANYEHIEASDCIVCAADLASEDRKHAPTISDKRSLYCRKCGIPARFWAATSCKGAPLVRPATPVVNSSPTILPMNW